MSARATVAIPVAARVGGFVYAIRNIVAEARKVEASGRTVQYLNIGDPITFGFRTPDGPGIEHLRGDARALPFDDGAFDFVIASLFFHHLTDDVAAEVLSEMRRVARVSVAVAPPHVSSSTPPRSGPSAPPSE